MTDCFSRIKNTRFIAILRHIGPEYMKKAAEALYNGGVRVFEVTFDPADPDTEKKTAESISVIKETYGDLVSAGAGTVLTLSNLYCAKNAGAEFAVSPVTDEKIICAAKENGMLSVPGAYTPNEIVNAYRLGGDIIKIFPVLPDGEAYLKNVISPLPHIPFIVTGGINPDTVEKFLSLGPVAVAAGASIITKADCEAGNYGRITDLALAHTSVCSGKR